MAKTGLIGLYSGRQIKINAKKRGYKLTRTQTAKQAFNFITKKYGKVVDNAKYFHVGKGEWRKYSLKNDSQFTGKMTDDKKEWMKQPHKLDYRGIDDKYGKAGRGEYFGKDLSKGKYSPKINTKRNVMSILKKKYPNTQFIVVGDWGFKNIGVIWGNGPSVSTLKKLDMSRGLKGKRDWIIGIDVDFKKETPDEFKKSLDVYVGNNDSKTFFKASTTLPIKMNVIKTSIPKKRVSDKFAISQIKQAKPKGRNTRTIKPIERTAVIKSMKIPLSLNKMSKKSENINIPRVSTFSIGNQQYVRVAQYADEYIDRKIKKTNLMDLRPDTLFYNQKNKTIQDIDKVEYTERGRPPRARMVLNTLFMNSNYRGDKYDIINFELNKIPNMMVYEIIIPEVKKSDGYSVNEFVNDWKKKTTKKKSQLYISAGTLDSIIKQISKFYGGSTVKLKQISNNEWLVYTGKGLCKGLHVKLVKKRYRFETTD